MGTGVLGFKRTEPEREPHAQEVRASLDAIVVESLLPLTLGLGGLYMLFVVLDGFLRVRQPSMLLATLDAIVGIGLLASHVAMRRRPLRSAQGHPALALLAGFVLLDIMATMALIPLPDQTLYLILFAIGVGSLALSSVWLAGLLGACIGAWIPFVILRPGGDWTTFGFGLGAAFVLALTFHAVRVAAYTRMEGLRLTDFSRKTELEIREEALQGAVQSAQESEERYRRLVENALDAFLVQSEGCIVYANAAAARLFAATTSEALLGINLLAMVHPDHLPELLARSALVEQGVTPPRLDVKLLRLDGAVVDVELTSQPILFAGRAAEQTVIRDVSDRIHVEQERALNAKRAAEIERLRELDRLKTQFVNTLSHELRTPLTPIKVQLHILKNAPKEGEARAKAMAMLERNLARLSSLVDEFLEVAKIQSGALKLTLARHDASRLLSESLESFSDVARANGVKLDLALEPELWADVDPKRLAQVVFNLMGNAMKFTPRDGDIRVEAARRSDAVSVRITDTGAGLRHEDIAKLFEPFSQVHDTMEKTNAGTGLGLYICRGIVESHGGRIGCESPGPGRGATFWFTIPAAEGPIPTAPIPQAG